MVKFEPKVVAAGLPTMLTLRSLIGSSQASITVADNQTLQLLGESGSPRLIRVSETTVNAASYDPKEVEQLVTAALTTPFDSSITTTHIQHLGQTLSSHVGITVEEGGTLIVPPTVVVAGGQTLKIYGKIVGLRNLIIDGGTDGLYGTVELYPSGHTDGAEQGNYAIDHITLRRGGRLYINTDANITSTTLNIGSSVNSGETYVVGCLCCWQHCIVL